jgi:hypothetical protein
MEKAQPLIIKLVKEDNVRLKKVIKALWDFRSLWYHKTCIREKLDEAKSNRDWLKLNA